MDDLNSALEPEPMVAPKSPALLAYEARRCAICNARYPAFGFVPPAIARGEVWACSAHRHEIERRLHARQSPVNAAARQLTII